MDWWRPAANSTNWPTKLTLVSPENFVWNEKPENKLLDSGNVNFPLWVNHVLLQLIHRWVDSFGSHSPFWFSRMSVLVRGGARLKGRLDSEQTGQRGRAIWWRHYYTDVISVTWITALEHRGYETVLVVRLQSDTHWHQMKSVCGPTCWE